MPVYRVTDPHAHRIGGKRVRADRTVELTDVEAVHELRIGSVVAWHAPRARKPKPAAVAAPEPAPLPPLGWAEGVE